MVKTDGCGFHHGNDGSVERSLHQAERAGAAPYVDDPRTPSWYPPAICAWSAAIVLAGSGVADRRAVAVPALAALLVLEGVFIGWYRR